VSRLPAGLIRGAGAIVPAPLKRPLGRVLGEARRVPIVAALSRLAAGRGPVVAGPWLGEVGFELLYWVPFLAWFVEAFDVDPARVTAVSRGGTRDWYRGVAGGYADVLERIGPEEFRARNEVRARLLGEQKQVAVTAFEGDLLAPVLHAAGGDASSLLHPSLMYALMRPFWWGHAGIGWVERHARFRAFAPPTAPAGLEALPDGYAAVKFYYSESFPPTPANRAFARSVVERLRAEGPVVSLSTGLALDDHTSWADEDGLAAYGIGADVAPSENLAWQSAVVGRARSWTGTYGGFAYLAPFFGVRAEAYYSVPDAFSQRHLALARHVFARLSGTPDLLEIRAA
jgi:hypothetical protein